MTLPQSIEFVDSQALKADGSPNMASDVRLTDGQFDFIQGIDSGKVTTIRSELVPNGLERSQLAWLTNGTVRGGSISQRLGWVKLTSLTGYTSGMLNGLYQGGWMYDPETANPYLVLSISGHIYKVLCEPPYTITDLSVQFALFNPDTEPKAFFCQAEQFLVIQAGDYTTLPLFWDGTTLRRSIGITNTALGASAPGVNEIPAAGPMDYYMGRLWYAIGRSYSAGDIVMNHGSGTAAYDFRDSVLNVTESPLCFGGDGFIVPSNAGNIRALAHSSAIDTTLGEGQLFIFTRKAIYKLVVPVDRTTWIAVDGNNQPSQTLVQRINGTYSDRSVVAVNGDLFYQSFDGIRSLMLAVKYFEQWGNTPISSNENRVLDFNDRSLMSSCSGIQFDNRLLQTCLPIQTASGIAFNGVIPLDFDLISTLQEKKAPAWEGMYEGLQFLQLFQGDFGGLQRAFTIIVSKLTGDLELWELTSNQRFDFIGGDPNATNRVIWFAEFPAYNFGKPLELKKLVGGEIWFDKLYGSVDIEVHYRVDADPCWQQWHRQTICSAESSCETVTDPVCYPIQPYREGFKWPVTLPSPPMPGCESFSKRPMNIGYQFQVRVALKGWLRIRGLILYADEVQKSIYQGLNC